MKEYIDRESVMQAFSDFVWNSNHSDLVPAPTWNHAVEIVRDIPAADVVEVRHGRWIWDDDGYWHRCSYCRTTFDYEQTHELFDHGFQLASYCPNCGAKMDGGVNDGG